MNCDGIKHPNVFLFRPRVVDRLEMSSGVDKNVGKGYCEIYPSGGGRAKKNVKKGRFVWRA